MNKDRHLCWLAAAMALALPLTGSAQMFLSEIMYHPVELAAFDANGLPLLDLSDDVHEFVELHNASANPVSLDGWRLAGGITFDFPPGLIVPPGGFIVVA